MFGKNGVKDLGLRFKYSLVIYGEYPVDDQPLSATSLRTAIKEAMDFENSIQPVLGLNAIKMFEITLRTRK
jgi:hypothetical protein